MRPAFALVLLEALRIRSAGVVLGGFMCASGAPSALAMRVNVSHRGKVATLPLRNRIV